MAKNKEKREPTCDYPVGYCRPPSGHRFRRGQSGNPAGRRRGSKAKTTPDEIKEIAAAKVTIRLGDRTLKVSLLAANIFTHATKGAQGDVRSAGLFLKEAQKIGLYEQGSSDFPTGPGDKLRPSDVVLGDLDLGLLSRDEQVELSTLAAVINRAGSIWALGTSDLERVRALVGKGSKDSRSGGDNDEASDAIRH